MASSFVLASLKPSTYRKEYASGFSLAVASLGDHFEQPKLKTTHRQR